MELHQIFLDMAVLVEAQGEMLDNIEAQVGAGCQLGGCWVSSTVVLLVWWVLLARWVLGVRLVGAGCLVSCSICSTVGAGC